MKIRLHLTSFLAIALFSTNIVADDKKCRMYTKAEEGKTSPYCSGKNLGDTCAFNSDDSAQKTEFYYKKLKHGSSMAAKSKSKISRQCHRRWHSKTACWCGISPQQIVNTESDADKKRNQSPACCTDLSSRKGTNCVSEYCSSYDKTHF